MTTNAQKITLNNALVAPKNRRGIGKFNMRNNPGMKPKEPTYQVVLDALALTTYYPAFLITDDIPGQEFDEPPFKEETLSFIRELGHSGEIKYITDVSVDHLHQPWRAFATIINKCLSGKVSGLGLPDSKKHDKMYYPRFTKAIIHHFLIKDKSISMRNRTFMHTARDDSLLGTIRFVSRHEDTQVYSALIPKAMMNQAMLDFDSYKTYYVIPTGAEPPKSKKPKRKSDSAISSKETPSKKKTAKANGEEDDDDEDEEEEYVDEINNEGDNANNATEENEEEEDDDEELYKDINVNLRKEDVEMTDADQGGAEQHNVSQESGFEQFLNLEKPSPNDNEIASLMDTTVRHEEPSNRYIDNKLGEAIQQAIQSYTAKCREEALAEKKEYIDLIDTSVRDIIKEEVKTQLPQILPQAVSDFATPSTYAVAASLSEFELTKILMDKMEEQKSYLRADYKRELYDALVKSYNTNKDLFESYGEVFTLKRNRDEKDKDQDPSVGSDRGTKRRKSSKDAESSRDPKSKEFKLSSSSKGTSRSQHKSSGKSVHAEEPSHTVDDSGV
ncbi:hypothetical protein Tco_0957689 [Tanacetum coccineum]